MNSSGYHIITFSIENFEISIRSNAYYSYSVLVSKENIMQRNETFIVMWDVSNIDENLTDIYMINTTCEKIEVTGTNSFCKDYK